MQITEQPSFYDHLEKKSVREILEDINQEDQKVALAVQKAIPQIEELVNQIVPRMKQGGRIFYMGAGTSGRLGVLDASEIPPTFGMSPNWIIGLIAGGDTALRNPVEGAEDDENRGWEELVEHQINEKDTVIGIAASGRVAMQAEYCICGKGMIISGDMFEYGNIAGCGIEDIDTSPVCSHPYFLFEFGHAQYDVTAQTGVLSGIAGYQFSLGGETLDAIVVG